MAYTVLTQVLILSCMILLGFILGRKGVVDQKGSDLLSKLLLDVFFPCNVLAAASGEFGDMPFSKALGVILAYLACFFLFTFLAYLSAKALKLSEDDTLVFSRSVAYPNNGFMGISLCSAVFGTQGAVLAALSVPSSTLYLFFMVMQSFRREREHGLAQQIKGLLTPLNLSTLTMIVMLAFGWKFTGAPYQFFNRFGACVMPTSMLIIGCQLSRKPLLDALRKPLLYLVTVLRGIVMPLLGTLLLRFTGWDHIVCLCIITILGCSVATTVSIFAVRYDRSPELASESVLHSNLFLPITMPLMMMLAEKILL